VNSFLAIRDALDCGAPNWPPKLPSTLPGGSPPDQDLFNYELDLPQRAAGHLSLLPRVKIDYWVVEQRLTCDLSVCWGSYDFHPFDRSVCAFLMVEYEKDGGKWTGYYSPDAQVLIAAAPVKLTIAAQDYDYPPPADAVAVCHTFNNLAIPPGKYTLTAVLFASSALASESVPGMGMPPAEAWADAWMQLAAGSTGTGYGDPRFGITDKVEFDVV
jgi:hypothetical protein